MRAQVEYGGRLRGVPAPLRVRGYRFFFFSIEGREPPHIHVAPAGRYAKFWLEPVSVADVRVFGGPRRPRFATLA